MNVAQGIEAGTSLIDERAKRDAMKRVVSQEALAGAERLKAFLTYIVVEEIEGRGSAILGKTIAQDVYGRTLSEKGDVDNIVRVDARRLRQHLDLYYERDGRTDPVRIVLDTGGYCPRFEEVKQRPVAGAGAPARGVRSPLPIFLFLLGLSAGIFGSYAVLMPLKSDQTPENSDQNILKELGFERLAIMEKSASSLQAVNLAEQARNMIFPIFDGARQILIYSVFQRVIEIDPGYFGGYAGAAQTAATLAMTMPKGAKREEFSQLALQSAEQALKLDPSQAWTQSAIAWAEFINGNYNKALRVSRRAVKLDGDDGHVLDFHGTITLFSGEFAEAIKASDRAHLALGANRRFANRNIFGAASLHLGKYAATVQSFESAAKFGDPLSAPSLAFTAVALARLGRKTEALEKLEELQRSWPNAPVADMLYGIYRNREDADTVLSGLRQLGWKQVSVN
ncbi:MAG: tetratricopeptide repeat protein [Hyphomicrobiales bacterium]